MKCSVCKKDLLGHPKGDTSNHLDGEPLVCCYCVRKKYKPGTLIELDFSVLEEQKELKEFNGIKGIIVRPLGTHEDSAGCLDYVVSWDWKDDKLYDFLKVFNGDNKELLDPRINMEFIKEVKE